jgi:regulator of sigma E protease
MFCLKPILIGGSVQIPDMETDDDSSPAYRPAVWKRLFVALAGIMANIITAFAILFLLSWFVGRPILEPTVIGFAENAPAKTAGISTGDIIVTVDGHSMTSTKEISAEVHKHVGVPTEITVRRNSNLITLTATPNTDGIIGVRLDEKIVGHHRLPALAAAKNSAVRIYDMVAFQINWLVEIFHASSSTSGHTASIKDVHGVVAMLELGKASWNYSWMGFWEFLAILNVLVAFGNILPMPGLDGGRVLFLILEKVRGRPLSTNVSSYLVRASIALLITAMLFAVVNDIMNPVLFK